jgi:predicted transposase/invertase (TIGR01784 family)
METDAFFYRLFSQLPQSFFELLGLPAARAQAYRFESVELKKAFRIDGLFLPKRRKLPLYFVEVQFQRVANFYANLFAKVFAYLEENDPRQDWVAVAIFPTRSEEPRHLGPYADLLQTQRVKRIYLEDLASASDLPVGLGVLQLLFASKTQATELAARLVQQASATTGDSELQAKVIELVERLLLLRFPEFDRETMRMKFKLHDIRDSKVWKEAHQEGREEGREEGRGEGDARRLRKTIETLLAKRKTLKEIGALLDISVGQIKAIMQNHSR